MQALRVIQNGAPLAALRVVDIDVPIPSAGQVRIKVGAASLNFNDIDRCYGRRISMPLTPPCFSIKAALGHTLGASGLAEMVAVLMCAGDGWLPPTAGFDTMDPELAFRPAQSRLAYAGGPLLLNIQGFGGCLASWVVASA